MLHLPLRAAAAQVGLGTTQFKLQCRKLGIKRWPYRKLKGLATAIATCRAESGGALPALDGAQGPAPALWAERLEALQDSLINREKLGDILIPPEVKKVASWGVKRRHLQRQGRRLSSISQGRLGRAAWVAALESADLGAAEPEAEVPRSARRGPARVPRRDYTLPL